MSTTIDTSNNPLHQQLMRLRPWQHSVAAAGAAATLAAVNSALNVLYARSRFPVPFAEGQTTFDATTLKGYYRFMAEAGTLDVYWVTQFFDFVFIAAMALAALALGSRLTRANRHEPVLRAVIGTATAAVVVGAGFDAIENLISFVMLARSETFADWIVYPYSSAAVIKFICTGIGWTGLMGSLLVTGVRAVIGLARRGQRDERAATLDVC